MLLIFKKNNMKKRYLGAFLKMESERLSEPEDQAVSCETVSPSHIRSDTHTVSLI